MLNHHHVNNTCDLIVYAKSIENNRTASDCMQCARVGNHTSNVCGNTFRFQSCCGFNVFCFKKPDDLRFFVHYMDWLMLTTTKQPPTPTQSHTHKHSHSDRLICKFTFNSYCPCGVGVLFLANMKSDMVLRFDWFCMIFGTPPPYICHMGRRLRIVCAQIMDCHCLRNVSLLYNDVDHQININELEQHYWMWVPTKTVHPLREVTLNAKQYVIYCALFHIP